MRNTTACNRDNAHRLPPDATDRHLPVHAIDFIPSYPAPIANNRRMAHLPLYAEQTHRILGHDSIVTRKVSKQVRLRQLIDTALEVVGSNEFLIPSRNSSLPPQQR